MNNKSVNKEIGKIKKEKNAIILAHYYTNDEVQDIADFVGDSLELSRKAAETNADIILFAGVKFMAETAKIISPDKKVLLPVVEAGCSLADSCPADNFNDFIKTNKNSVVISYINSSIEIKAMSDLICTSSNAVDIVNSLDKKHKIIFGPDKNLGQYVKSKVDHELIIWQGACHVHDKYRKEYLIKQRKMHKEAKIISHPECNKEIQDFSDFVGSTSKMLTYIQENNNKQFIIVTDPGIIHQMKKLAPEKVFIPAEPIDNVCEYMKMNTPETIYQALETETNDIQIAESLLNSAYKPIADMLKISSRIMKS